MNHVKKPRWDNIFNFTLLHLGVLAAPFYFSWSGLVVCFLGWVITGMGITLGWHRLFTHGSFTTYPLMKYILTFLGYLNWENSLIEWVGTHRLHHEETETSQDPHTPRRGWFWSHIGWGLFQPSYDPREWAQDVAKDPVIGIVDRYHWLFAWGSLPVLYGIGEWMYGNGFSWVIWGGCVRGVLVLHSTWLVNSAAHSWGYQNFETSDDSRNLWWVALFSLGEGWHNNHHHHPRCAAHGLHWWELDPTYWTILCLSSLGLVWDVVSPREHIPIQT